jgi:hypothetical protein
MTLLIRATTRLAANTRGRVIGRPLACVLAGLVSCHVACASEILGRNADVVLGHRVEWTALGASLAWVGDTDGDGLDELLVGASHALDGAGEALLVHGSTSGRSIVPGPSVAALFRRTVDTRLGLVVAAAGDVDGDGYPDVWVGDKTNFYLLRGSDRGIVPMSEALAVIQAPKSVQLIGGVDLSGDGIADLVISTYDDGAFVLDGPFSGLIDAESAARLNVVNLDDGCEEFGEIIGVGSDLDGDGHQDLLVGADNVALACDSSRRLGFVRADLSGRIDLSNEADPRSTVIVGSTIHEGAMVGDVNGDGFDDLAVSAPHDIRVLWGPITADVSFEGAPGWTLEWPYGSSSGWSMRGAGDIDGDGRAEFAIAGNDADFDETLLVVPGSAVGLEDWMARSLRVILPLEAELEEDGLLGGHDADGDGIPELVIATKASHGQVIVLNGRTMAALLP